MKCFACDKKIPDQKGSIADTKDGQLVYVGPQCYRNIKAFTSGYQPPKGGPRLFVYYGDKPELEFALQASRSDPA